jgi:amidase
VPTFIARTATDGSGLRVAVKDLIDMAGLPTTNGSKVVAAAARPAVDDAACLSGTRAAEAEGRAAIVGKTNMHELAFGVTGVNPWFGTPVNPRAAQLIPGGSSSGSAVAVGAGEADVAFGSDTGGSIRIPAACCGVVGLKTTRGRVPTAGVCPLAPSLDSVGPMAATVGAVATGMSLLEPGFRPGDAAARIGRLGLPAHQAVDAAVDAALLESGIEVIEVAAPGWDGATLAAMTILCSEAWAVHAELWKASGSDLSPDVAARLEASSLIGREETAVAWEQARAWSGELEHIFDQVDVIALPTLADQPPDLDHASRIGEIRYAAPVNLAGVPAISLPVRPVGASGPVPPSLQLIGPRWGEETLVATAAVVEAAAGWTPPS